MVLIPFGLGAAPARAVLTLLATGRGRFIRLPAALDLARGDLAPLVDIPGVDDLGLAEVDHLGVLIVGGFALRDPVRPVGRHEVIVRVALTPNPGVGLQVPFPLGACHKSLLVTPRTLCARCCGPYNQALMSSGSFTRSLHSVSVRILSMWPVVR